MREGRPSFKLTDLSAANGLLHEAAHDALSDVRATHRAGALDQDRAAQACSTFVLACTKKTA